MTAVGKRHPQVAMGATVQGPGGDGGTQTGGVRDPNDKVTAAGFGEAQFVAIQQVLPYTIHFENVAEATAHVNEVRVTDQLDPNLDWRTFRLREIAFGNKVITVPENRSFYQTRLELGSDYGYMLLDIDAGLDVLTGKIHWYLTTIDPSTGLPPENPLLGFLPPNDENQAGEGHVIFTIKPKSDLPTGAIITNKATIFFDTNEPLDTNEVSNTVDGVAPSSAVSSLPEETQDINFTVTWSGQDDDGGSGLGSYDIYVSDNEGAYELWLGKTSETSAIFAGQPGHSYRFYSMARDNAGNFESPPDEPDAVATVRGEIAYHCDKDSDSHVNASSDGTCAGLNCPPAGCQEEAGDDCNDNDSNVYPGASEICDGKDNNCDGQIDEGFDVGAPCSAGIGACKSEGVKVCSADGLSTVCNAVAGTPTVEICGDGIDNNCDGQIDEGFDVGYSMQCWSWCL